jgi:hypothetical protein
MINNNKLLIFPYTALFWIALSCKKGEIGVTPPAAINVVNSMSASYGIFPVFGTNANIDYANAVSLPFGTSALFSPPAGSSPFYVIQSTDTAESLKPQRLFSGALTLDAGAIYSLFLIGDTTKPDTLFIRDQIPTLTDSVSDVRFVNLVQGGPPLSISVETNGQSQTSISNLNYKGVSSWDQFAATSNIPGYYYFVVTNTSTGDTLAVDYWILTVNRCNTIVLTAPPGQGSSGPSSFFQMNNF